MWNGVQYKILRKISPGAPSACSGTVYEGKSKLAILLGKSFLAEIEGRSVIDFGCGEGAEAVEMALKGAGRVIGIDMRDDLLEKAKENARAAGVEKICHFSRSTPEQADIIISLDAFEHFSEPDKILTLMAALLKPGGKVIASFGPTWYHPLGGHLFSVFPWAHLIFSERALIRWRSDFKSDGATRFGEVAGGLNQMTIGRFEKLIAKGPLRCTGLELVPIRKLKPLHNRFTREFTTALVRCSLTKAA